MKNKTNLSFITIILILVGSIFLTACDGPANQPGTTNIPGLPSYNSETTTDSEQQIATQELKEFKNVEELKAFIQANSNSAYSNLYYGRNTLMMADMAMSAKTVSEGALTTSGGSADDYSTTNIQVEGVDEADFIKNDAQYIYMIADNKLIIIDAYDAENAEIISTTKIENTITDKENSDYWNQPTAKELFINGNKLILFVEVNERAYYFPEYQIRPQTTYRQKTYAYIYDIADKKNPELEKTFSATGSYYESRMINEMVYIITQEAVNNYYPEPRLMIDENTNNVQTIMPKIYYFDNPETNYQHNTIISVDIENNDVIDSKTFMLGYANTLMVSENNIYIAYQKQTYWPCRFGMRCFYNNYNDDTKKEFYDVVVPLLDGEIKSDIKNIIAQDLNEEEEWSEISKVLSKFYENIATDEDMQEQYEEMFGEIEKAKQEYELKQQMEYRKTIIHKIGIDNGEIEYKAKGEVYGSLLNQFSLDEYEGNLRLATTINAWANKQIQYNNVYVLDENMKTIGTLEELGKDERIYSTRFLGDKLYIVTYKQIDPLFVIDLSNPKEPEVLGYLKIPGYSDYLHPYDATHIIGIGKETETNEYGGTITKGLKIALFDVSDFENPKLVDKYEIGDRGTDSPALHDHKAFLFSKTKNMLVLPVTEITEKTTSGQYMYDYKLWNGAYVFDVSAEGFELKGKVKHSSSTSSYYNWWNQASVLRSLYMDDNLYTISNKYVKINDLGNDLKELNSIDLPYSENNVRYY